MVHPFLIGLYPVVALLASNLEEMRVPESYRSIIFILIGVAVMLILFKVLLQEWNRAAILASLYITLFFLYGHVYSLLEGSTLRGILLGRHRFLLPLWIAAAVFGSWLILRRIKDYSKTSRYMTVFSAILVVIPFFSILRHSINLSRSPNNFRPAGEFSQSDISEIDPSQSPDIYYIILDAYNRSDVLQQQFNYDNSAFIKHLEETGFYVASQSVSNYMWTRLSLSSSLNMDYLPDPDSEFSITKDNVPEEILIQLRHSFMREHLEKHGISIQHSYVRERLEKLGYSIVSYPSGWIGTEVLDADYKFSPDTSRLNRDTLNAFEVLLIHTSGAKVIIDISRSMNLPLFQSIISRLEDPFFTHREMLLSNLNNLPLRPDIPGPIFAFVHIVAPHEPYVFGPEGETVEYHGAFSLADIDNIPPSEEASLYIDQLNFVTKSIIETIDAIISNSDRPPVIILQADHGFTPLAINWSDHSSDALRARMSILNAYYIPETCQESLYPTITPVNSFRVVFNCIFNDSYEVLEDISYANYVNWERIEAQP
jgi:hypothetical protein